MEHDCGGSTDMDTDGDEDKEVDCSSISKGNSVEEELSLFLGEASSADVSKVLYSYIQSYETTYFFSA